MHFYVNIRLGKNGINVEGGEKRIDKDGIRGSDGDIESELLMSRVENLRNFFKYF